MKFTTRTLIFHSNKTANALRLNAKGMDDFPTVGLIQALFAFLMHKLVFLSHHLTCKMSKAQSIMVLVR